jgi:hypothetical protein
VEERFSVTRIPRNAADRRKWLYCGAPLRPIVPDRVDAMHVRSLLSPEFLAITGNRYRIALSTIPDLAGCSCACGVCDVASANTGRSTTARPSAIAGDRIFPRSSEARSRQSI